MNYILTVAHSTRYRIVISGNYQDIWANQIMVQILINIQAFIWCIHRTDSRLAPSKWEMPLQSNAISHWLGTNLESALILNDKNIQLESISAHWKICQQKEDKHQSIRIIMPKGLLPGEHCGGYYSGKSTHNSAKNQASINKINKIQWNLNTNIMILIQQIASENVIYKVLPFCLGLNVLTHWPLEDLNEILDE